MNSKTLLSSLVICLCMTVGLLAQTTQLYVHAPSGLNLRQTAASSSAKLATVDYGTKVTLEAAASKQDMVIDNLKGGMAKVTANGKTGYMFSGYLSPYPTPKPGGGTEDYVFKLRDAQIEYTYEEHKYDNDGHIVFQEVFYLKKDDWYGAWLVVTQLYKIPKGIRFPAPSDTKDQTIFKNPNSSEFVWADELTVDRKHGKITKVNYYQRGEGGGWSVTMEPGTKENYKEDKMKVTLQQVAD